MHIREAALDDNHELQELQAKCPMGTTLILTTVNTPDFFARAKAYESYKVFVACEDDRIIGSGACAIREAVVGGNICRVAYQFQLFTSPDHRRRSVATLLHQHQEDYLASEGVALSYVMILEGNVPSMRFIEGHGFKLHRTLVMPSLAVSEEMDVASTGRVRRVTSADLAAVAQLLNVTWEGYDLCERTSAEALARFIDRTPQYSFDNLLVLEDQGQILACLGFWDWSRITRITVIAAAPEMRAFKPGDRLKQMLLTRIAFKEPQHLDVLLRYVNNLALRGGVGQIFCICEPDHVLLGSMKGFMRIDTAVNLCVKSFQEDVCLADNPVFIDGIDL